MSETVEQKVGRFVEFNQTMIENAVESRNLEHQGVHAKVLLCSILDSLGRSRFPEIKRNGERFVSLLDGCSNWPEKDHVSLLHLARAFDVESYDAAEFSDVQLWVVEQMQRYFQLSNRLLSVHVPIVKDPQMSVVLESWPQSSDSLPQRLGTLTPNRLQHKHLLWLYRNSLVHEYRLPGRGAERYNLRDSSAYYQQVAELEGLSPEVGLQFSNRWELIYPTGFFKRLAEQVLQCVAEFHLSNGTSPFEAYSEGSYWIPAYNDEC